MDRPERYTGALLKSYAFHPESGRWWFVSSIDRNFGIAAAPDMVGTETLVWELPEGPEKERGALVHQGGPLFEHFGICASLVRTGELPKEPEE